MLVKCWDINEKREKSESYKAPNGKYYTSEKAYLALQDILVKCWDTNEKHKRSESYKAPNGKYYTSEDAYLKMRHTKEMRDKIYDLMIEILPGYDEQRNQLPTNFNKYEVELDQKYGVETVYETIINCRESIEYATRTKEFNSQMSMITYIMSIIRNNIHDVYMHKKYEEKNKNKQYAAAEPLEIQTNLQKNTKDISAFISEDDDE